MAAHALLSASSSERWMNCTPSARLNEKQKDVTSVYAELGTMAHEMGELLLRIFVGGHDMADIATFEDAMQVFQKSELYYEGMIEDVEAYVDYVKEQYNEALEKTKDAKIFLEERLDYSSYVPEGFGTGDCIIIADGEMEIIDLKFGTEVEVSPVDNPQLKLYALGAYEKYGFIYGIEKITMTIAQVRLNNISSSSITADMLTEWAEKEVIPAAEKAYKGKGDLRPGPWCGFCKVRNTCKARTNMYKGFHPPKDPNVMNNEELAEVLAIVDDLAKWAKEIKEYSLEIALKGEKIPGFKLVEGRSNRQITDSDALASLLMENGYSEDKIYKPKTLEGITNLEKVVGKKNFTKLAGEFITKPPGKPTLTTEDDKRPAMDSAEDDFF